MPASTHVELVLTQQTLRLRECVCLHCVIHRDAVFFHGAFMSAESIRLIRDGTSYGRFIRHEVIIIEVIYLDVSMGSGMGGMTKKV